MTGRRDRCGLAWPWLRVALLAAAMLAAMPAARADETAAWLDRAAAAAQQQNYMGTIVYQHGGHVETSRLVHLFDNGSEFEKLVNLEGPAREVIRSNGEVRCFYPDARIVRIEPRTFRNAFPSLSPQQRAALADYYHFRMAERGRVAGIETQAWVFEPKDGLRYGHKFWADPVSGLLVKARIYDERNEVVEQFAFTEISIGIRIDREMVKPTWPVAPPDWQVRQSGPGEAKRRRRAGRSPACRPGSSRSSMATGGCAGSTRWRTSSTRTASLRSPYSSSRSAALHIRSERRARAASTSSSGSRTTI